MSKLSRVCSFMLALALLLTLAVFPAAQAEEEPLELTSLAISYGATPDQLPDHWANVEKLFNIKYTVDWAPDGDAYGEKLQLRLSSGALPDLIQIRDLSEASVAQALKAGLFAPLDEALGDFSKYPNLADIMGRVGNLTKVDGKSYLIPRTRGQYNMPVTIIRWDWLEELGMDIPRTMDEFAAYLKGVKAAHPDVIPCPAPLSWERIPSAFGPGSIDPVYAENGGLVHTYLTESYAQYLEYWRDLYAADCLAKEYALLTTSQMEEMFMTGQTATSERNIYHYKRLESELNKRTPEGGKAYPLLYLQGPNGYAFHYDQGFWGGMVISAQVTGEKLDRVLKFLDQTSDPANFNFLCWGDEGVHWNMVDGEVQLTEKGTKEISSSSYSPFIIACDLYQKVNSPYATPEENAWCRELVKEIDEIGAKYESKPLNIFKVIISDKWAKEWAKVQDEFKEFEVDVITGKRTVDDFRAFQQELLDDKGIQEAMLDLKRAADELGFPEHNPLIAD